MAELVDATDLIQLSLGRKTYQVLAFRFRETQVEEEIGDPEPNLVFIKWDRCRDSMEAILTRNITLTLDLIRLFIQINKYIYVYICILKQIHQIEISEMDL